MTDDELQIECDQGVELVLETVAHFPAMLRLIILTGALGACAFASNVPREKVINALNSVFDDIEQGEIPGETLNKKD